MKKRINAFIVIIFILGIVVINSDLSAATAEYKSNSEVEFGSNLDAVTPVSPYDPDKVLPDEEGTGMIGAVTLDYVPSLPFGSKKIHTGTNTFRSTNTEPYVQVTDKSGDYFGYTLSVKLGKFINDNDPTKYFNGLISFSNGEVITSYYNSNIHPKTSPTFSIASSKLTPQVVLEAKAGEGRATFLTTWLPDGNDPDKSTNNNVTLTIDEDSVFKGSYTSIITWELSFTPSP